MFDLNIVESMTFAGKAFALTQTVSNPDGIVKEESVPIAWKGSLTTRTSDTAGTVTMDDAGHLISTGAEVDIYWQDADGIWYRAYGATNGTVSGTSVPFTGASGTVLPAADTTVYVSEVQTYTISSFAGNDMTALVAACDVAAATIRLILASGPTTHLVIEIPSTGAYGWWGVGTNPLAGDTVDQVKFSHADTSTAQSVRVGVQLDL